MGIEQNKLYRKKGRKYEAVGYEFHRDYLTDGIWYVRSNGSKITNGSYLEGLFKVCDKPLFTDFSRYCDLHDLAENIMDDPTFREFMDRAYKDNKGWSVNDIVHVILAILEKRAQNKENNKA